MISFFTISCIRVIFYAIVMPNKSAISMHCGNCIFHIIWTKSVQASNIYQIVECSELFISLSLTFCKCDLLNWFNSFGIEPTMSIRRKKRAQLRENANTKHEHTSSKWVKSSVLNICALGVASICISQVTIVFIQSHYSARWTANTQFWCQANWPDKIGALYFICRVWLYT